MGPNVDKLFLEVAGAPVIAHTWRRFDSAPGIDFVVLVVRKGMESAFEDLAASLCLKKPWRLALGGAERQDSVGNGLDAVPPGTEIVAIQDGARPCTADDVIAATIDAAREYGAAVAAQQVTDTIKESLDGLTVARTIDRARLWAVQTPQTFRVAVIRQALAEVRGLGLNLTDDTAACEHVGQAVRLVPTHAPNPKVTRSEDLHYVETLLRT